MGLAHLADRMYGPRALAVTADRVRDFVDVTGDDQDRWAENAPPGFAVAAVFVVAPELLGELGEHSVVHGEQTFTWHRPVEMGEELVVSGKVTKVRERGGVHYVGFDIRADLGAERVLEGSSLFLVTGLALPVESTFVRPEPPHSLKGAPGPGELSASRADLVRYAAVTKDWNPIHWDHDAAVTAGLPGVVVHGLLQASWAFIAASRHRKQVMPFRMAKVRFRNPLLPGRPVAVATMIENSVASVSIFDADQEYLSAKLELASE